MQIFSAVRGLSFHLQICLLMNIFSSDELPFINFFSFKVSAFLYCLCLFQGHNAILPCLLLENYKFNFYVYVYDPFQINFHEWNEIEAKTYIFPYVYQCSSIVCRKDFSYSIQLPQGLCQKWIDQLCESIVYFYVPLICVCVFCQATLPWLL